MKKKNVKVLVIGVFLALLVGTIGLVSAMSNYEKSVYDSITNPLAKLSYSIAKGFLFFTSWGQQNQCSTYPDWEGWIRGSMTQPSNLSSSVSCSKVGTNKCAIDIWYDNTIYLGSARGPPSSVNWNNWLKEVNGVSASFSSSSKPYYYVQVYSCPDTVTPPTTTHDTKVYTCNPGTGGWTSRGSFSSTESCSYDTSGQNKCYCFSSSSNFYVDEAGGVHCQPSSYSSVTDGTWCSAVSMITVYRFSNNQCTQLSIDSTKRTSFDYDTLSQCESQINSGVDKGEIIINGAVEVIPAPVISGDRFTTIKVPLKNAGTKAETINLEGGFYSSDYACRVAKLYPCSGTLGSVFPFFSSVPVPNVNPAEDFVKTKQVTLEPGETEIVELKVNPLSAFATYSVGTTNVKSEPLVWFVGLYKTPAGGNINEAGDVGKGILFDYAQYSPNPLLGGCSNIIGPKDVSIFCGNTVIGKCSGDTLTLEKTCDITPTLEVINGTPATATPVSTTLSSAKKITLTKAVISTSTSADLLASSCLSSSECILPTGDDKTFSASCIPITKLRDDGTLTEADSKEFFDNAGTITKGTFYGATAGIVTCAVGWGIVGTLVGGPGGGALSVANVLANPATLGSCAGVGALLGGTGTSMYLDTTQDDELLKQLKANNANAVGICTKESKSNFDNYLKWAAWFDVNGDGNKDGTDGLIIVIVLGALSLMILRK